MPGSEFLPTAHGLRFANSWPDQALVVVGGNRLFRFGIGNANRGLCGGMVFTAMDVFAAGLPPLADPRPSPASPLYRYIVRRQFDSFNLPFGVLEYYRSMVAADEGLRRRTIDEWTSVKSELDAARPVPLGLITQRSANPADLGHNHQVLAYRYQQHQGRVTIEVYDPNTAAAGADHVWLSFALGPNAPSVAIAHNLNIGRPIRGFFRVPYRRADPSAVTPSRTP